MEEQFYNTITYLVIFAAVAVAGLKIVQKHFKQPNSPTCTDGCGGCNSKCDLKELVKTQKME